MLSGDRGQHGVVQRGPVPRGTSGPGPWRPTAQGPELRSPVRLGDRPGHLCGGFVVRPVGSCPLLRGVCRRRPCGRLLPRAQGPRPRVRPLRGELFPQRGLTIPLLPGSPGPVKDRCPAGWTLPLGLLGQQSKSKASSRTERGGIFPQMTPPGETAPWWPGGRGGTAAFPDAGRGPADPRPAWLGTSSFQRAATSAPPSLLPWDRSLQVRGPLFSCCKEKPSVSFCDPENHLVWGHPSHGLPISSCGSSGGRELTQVSL